MKHTRLALAFAFASLLATSASAASLTMLQFGSFETRAEAQKRLAEVSAKHAAFIGKLATNIREVKLPPDNLTVYRTQAGPVESRTAAQAICSQLASAGDECYIVQTAMVSAPENAPTLADAKTAVTAPVAAALSDAKSEAVKAVTPSPDLTSKLTALNDTPTPARDPLNRAALNSISAPTVAEVAAPASDALDAAVEAPVSIEMNKALDKAIDDKATLDSDVSTATKDAVAPRRGFWSRLNPFGAEEPSKSPVVKKPEAVAAPVEAVAEQALDVAPTLPELPAANVKVEAPKLEVSKLETPVLVATAKAPVLETPAAPAVVNLSKAPIKLDSAPVIMHADPLPLPPPPAPLKAQDREVLAAAVANPAVVAPHPEPIATGIVAKPLLPTSQGSVQVEEAKRVPVTQATTLPSVAPTVQAVPVVNAAPAVSLSPSSTEGQKALWAQIGSFSSNEAALTYWSNYRQNHPDFPVVRVRVTAPYQQLAQGKGEYWLRVGPVAQAGFVTNLCASLPQQTALRCGMVRDLGTSSPLQGNSGSSTSRYKH